MTIREQVYQVVSSTSGSVRAEDVANKIKAHPSYIRQELAKLFREGMVKRRLAKVPDSRIGKKPYAYYVDFSAPPVERPSQEVIVLVGDIRMSVTEARKLYDQLKLLFG